jgi:hypothetical protein
MDASHFDALVRLVTVSSPRRAVLRAGLTLTLVMFSARDSEAKKRKKKCTKKCGPCEKCKKGKCKNTASGKEPCGGNCVERCPSGPPLATERNPLTCDCCVSNGQSLGGNFCLTFAPCCSAKCSSGTCVALEQGEACDFDAQCESRNCDNGECA